MRAKAPLLVLAALCAGAALPSAQAACQIDVPLDSSSRLGVGGVFTFSGSAVPWPIWGWNKSPVVTSVRVTFPWSGSCNFTSSTIISSANPDWVAAAAGAQLSTPAPLSATATLQGKYGGFAARGTYDVNFNVQGFKFNLASGPSQSRVAARPFPVSGLSSSAVAGNGTLKYNIDARWGLGKGSGDVAFDLAGRAVDATSGCRLAFRPSPYNDVRLDCSKLKIALAQFAASAPPNSTATQPVNLRLVFSGWKIRGIAPITAAASV